MNITIRIEADNEAFADDNCGYEIARILERVAHRANQCPDGRALDGLRLMDSNGNPVGSVEVDE